MTPLNHRVQGFLVSFLFACVVAIENGAYFEPGLGFLEVPATSFHSQQVFHPSQSSAGFLPVFQMTSGYQLRSGSSPSPNIFTTSNGVDDDYYDEYTDNYSSCPIPSIAPCQDSKYRTIDGSCNNLKNPAWGTPQTRYARLLPPKYSDGIHRPPLAVSGKGLPSARLISIVLHPDVPVGDPEWTLVTMSWGQMITHDMSMARGTTQTKPHKNMCCSSDGKMMVSMETALKSCYAIPIPVDDPVYSKFGQTCMNFLRSDTDVNMGCAPPHQAHEQIVTVTHWMDASLVYGPTNDLAAQLREGSGGRLRVDQRSHRSWPPEAANKTDTCELQTVDEPCYQFGDVRGNQNPGITILQIILLREHNRVADILAQLNPHWDDETIYQEARRIVIAEVQHITYYEYLPFHLGKKNMLKRGLIYKTDGYVNDYREDVQPNVINEHAQAAFKYFHTAIQGQLEMISEPRSVSAALRLSDYFNRPGIIEEKNYLDQITRGMTTQSQDKVDAFFTSEVTDFLFRNNKPFGRDLKAVDIQRGRDHGLASYNDFRQFCGLPRAKNFRDFSDLLSKEDIDKLSLLYESVDDVDLVEGAGLETHEPDTLVGPTFLCILQEQFYRTRVADRFFYERGNHPAAFTPDQLREIRKTTIARLLCDNSDNIQSMQREGFRVISDKNPLVSCHDVSSPMDLSFWQEVQHV